jgi:adenosylmethionine-8-amino-7-oxononanoate aminotransferase
MPLARIILEGEGCYVVDESGRRMFDGLAGLWCVNLGCSSRSIVRAGTRQLQTLPYYPSFFNSTQNHRFRWRNPAEKAPSHGNLQLRFRSQRDWKLRGRPQKRKIFRVRSPIKALARDLIAVALPLIISYSEIDELFDCIRRGLDGLWN